MILSGSIHAVVNAMIKSGPDRVSHSALLATCSGLVVLPAVPFVSLPHGAWGWLALAMVAHVGYTQMLTRALDAGDLSSAYPIFRGTAPLLSAMIALFWLGEALTLPTLLGIILILAGTLAMIAGRHVDKATLIWSLLTAVFIATYTVVDAIAVRAAPEVAGFIVWFFILLGLSNLANGFVMRGRALIPYYRENWKHAGTAGALSVMTFGLALIAFSMGDVAPLAALRETGMVTALLISIFVLKERVTLGRALAILCITGGAVIIVGGQA